MQEKPVTLAQKLGYSPSRSAYFLRAPSEYWQALGSRQKPYDDQEGEYEFVHAFFSDKHEMSGFADILVSKLAADATLWISWPKLSVDTDIPAAITEQDVREVFSELGLHEVAKCQVTELWLGMKFVA